MKLYYGTQEQVSFRDINEYYFALGFLANSRNAELRWENNEDQGAWGSEGRIHCLVPETQFPHGFRFTAGRGNIYARINCNEYVGKLMTEHNFNYNGRGQNLEKILETVPNQYRDIFMEGYGSKIAIKPDYKPETPHSAQSTTNPTQGGIPKAVSAVQNPGLIDVAVGENLLHKIWDIGTVTEVKGNYIKIKFTSVGEKSFINPDAFIGGFLKKVI